MRILSRLALHLQADCLVTLLALTLPALVGPAAGRLARAADPAPARLELNQGDHVCIVGGTVAERMQHFGWLETLIQARFPQHELVFRNLAYSGDEIDGFRDPNHRLRSRDFGSQDQWLSGSAPIPQPGNLSSRDKGKVSEDRFKLTGTKADVVLAFFGYGESRAGAAGLEAFKRHADAFAKHTLAQKYNGRSAPKLVLFSPIAHEWLDNPNLPGKAAVEASNANLKLYGDALAGVAKDNGVLFVDLFGPTRRAWQEKPVPGGATINGVHQNERGDRIIAAAAETALFGAAAAPTRDLDALRAAVNDKNFYWFQRHRTTDGYSTYGDRAFLKFSEGPGGYGDGLSNYSVLQRELEALDVLTANRDRVVWAAAQGKSLRPQDNNLPEFLTVITNKPGSLPGGKHQYLSGQEAIGKMKLHKGMKVQCFADEEQFPELVSPVQMAFDTKGRLWVAAWPNYPHWKPTTAMDDKLLILEDTDADGRADRCTTFAGDLQNPTGFEFWNGGVLVAQGPDVVFLKDTNGDDKYDLKERLIHGLDTADTHHTANSFVLDPGGALYFQEGTFHHSQIETPWGTTRRVANGAVFRYDPRQMKFDVYVSFGFANPHGHVFDRWGQDIVWDGTGSQPYHALLFSGDTDYPHKHGGTPQVYQQRTRPCSGTEILSSSHFPEELRGNLLVNNVIGDQGILQYRVQERDSSFAAVEVEPIVLSSDPNFRPSDVEVAPDGSLYFTDWQNVIIGHMQHNLRDPSRNKTKGRVYRVTYPERPLVQPAPIAGQPLEKLLDLLKQKDDRVRYRARIELSGRPTAEVIAAAKQWLAAQATGDPDYEHHALEILWLHQSHNVVDVELLKRMLRSPESRARAAATRVLAYWRDRLPEPLELLRTQATDDSGRVRLQALWALSYFDGPDAEKAAEVAVESLIQPQDRYLKHQFDATSRTLDRRAKQAKQ